MPLTIELSLAIASTRTTAVLSDNTVYGTGGNPARSAVAVFAKAYKVSFSNEASPLVTVGNDADPETDSSWTITLSSMDGYNKVNFAIIPDFDNSLTYDIYDAVFNPADNKVFRSLQDSNTEDDLTNTTWWEEIASPADLAANKDTIIESLNITSVVYLRVLSPNSQFTFANNLSAMCACTDCDQDQSLHNYNIFAMWLDGVAIADSRSEVLDGELLCRRIQSKFIDCVPQ